MSIGTFISLMTNLIVKILLSEGTPNSFILVNVKVVIFLKQMN